MEQIWLMIYDNADGPPSLVQKYLPQGNKGNIIVTSRNGALMRLTSNCGTEVVQMEPEEAGLLLARAGGFNEGTEEESCKKIVEKLGYIPLAVDMAGAYIQTTHCSPAQYLELFSTECKRLLNDPKYTEETEYGHTTYGTWEISMQRIESKALNEEHTGAQSAIKILNIMGFLHHVNVPLDIFKRAAVNYQENTIEEGIRSTMKPELLHLNGSGHWDQYLFNSGIQELSTFSFIQKRIINEMVSMHPLVHRWIKDR
ncbi:hypothetical protein AMATHDRAFT_160975, partial [Amanita thiersii Skay4041]